MRLWRARYGHDNGYDGLAFYYARAERDARRVAKERNDAAQLPPESIEVERVDVPTDKQGLIDYLNRWHSQAA